jgi:hypothetical protein
VTEQHLLNRLKEAQAQYALLSLQTPSGKNEFEYGYRCGVVAGLEKAINTLLQAVEEERRDDDPL